MQFVEFTITGDVNVHVTITENDNGTLTFDVVVLDDTGSIGDLQGLFFDLADDSIADSLSAEGADVTYTKFNDDGVTKLTSGVNINGEVLNEYGKFDGGIQFGTAGIGKDDIQETSFVLSSTDGPLTLADFLSQDMAIRLTSVGEEGGSRDDSLKLGGSVPEDPTTEEPPVEPPVVNTALDDFLTVFASEDAGNLETLDDGATTVLANDLTDAVAYTGAVTAVNGDALSVAAVVEGSNGGFMTIYSDGSIDFDAAGEFDDLEEDAEIVTQFSYTIDGGDTADVFVTVIGEDSGDGGFF